MSDVLSGTEGLTRRLVETCLRTHADELPDDVRRIARDCLVDWLACSFAGRHQPVSRIVVDAALDEGGHPQATLIGGPERVALQQAALVNGTISHALDYDDVNLSVPGHMSAAILPALVALGEHRGADAEQWIEAFVAGYEFACRIGVLVEPAHYANGFHTTATIGSLGAAMACARLLALPVEATCHAIGLAATQAAGLKAMFGSMAKPLHAGLASQAGLRSALLASKGFVARTDVLECPQGYGQVHGSDFHWQDALATPTGGHHLLNNLFKFHAACYSTHSTIEAVAALRQQHRIAPASVRRIEVVADEGCRICNIQAPATGLEAKFSLRACAAFALLGLDTADLDSWNEVTRPDIAALIDRVSVQLVPGMTLGDSIVTLLLDDGRSLRLAFDCSTPIADKAEQSRRVAAKFRAIAPGRERVLQAAGMFDREGDIAALMHLCRDS